LNALVRETCPDIILTEHFPFSKMMQYDEVIGLVTEARRLNKQVRIFSSVRAITPPDKYDPSGPEAEQHILRTVNTYFDGVLCHSDPEFIRIEEHVPNSTLRGTQPSPNVDSRRDHGAVGCGRNSVGAVYAQTRTQYRSQWCHENGGSACAAQREGHVTAEPTALAAGSARGGIDRRSTRR
jgi:hypothetical protein